MDDGLYNEESVNQAANDVLKLMAICLPNLPKGLATYILIRASFLLKKKAINSNK